MKNLKYLIIPLFFLTLTGFFGRSVIPEMKKFTQAFENQEKLTMAVEKYSEPGVTPDALTLCNLAEPLITKIEKKESIIYYTCEAKVEKCSQSPKAVGTVRIFTMGWENGKIISFEWGGPKSGAVEY